MSLHHRSILLADYVELIRATDRLSETDLQPVLLGLYGEVGGIMAAAKKFHREGEAFAGYREAVEEEFGDALWYFAGLCRRLGISLDAVFSGVANGDSFAKSLSANDLPQSPISHVATPLTVPALDAALLKMGDSVVGLFPLRYDRSEAGTRIASFASDYLHALSAARVSFAEVLRQNVSKTRGRFLEPDYTKMPTFDEGFPEEERLPEQFEIVIDQRRSGRAYLRWNGVFIGDPLTDNISDPDGYRFHDVFHFAHAAILHWSPTFRALIKQKRKSDRATDEAQDGGRAIVVEEGLTAWIFARAKELDYFKGQTGVSFDLLKTVRQFVSGYEVAACPLKLWEIAILQGYEVFRNVRDNRGGRIIGDRRARTITYMPLEGSPR